MKVFFRVCLVLALACRTLVDSRRASITRIIGPKKPLRASIIPWKSQKLSRGVRKPVRKPIPHIFKNVWYQCCMREGGQTTGLTMNGLTMTNRECCQRVAERESSLKRSAQAWVRLGSLGGASVHSRNYSVIECYAKALDEHSRYECCMREGGSLNKGSRQYSDRECCQMVAGHESYANESSLRRSVQAWVRLGSLGGAVVHSQSYSAIQCYEKAVEAAPTGNNWMNLALMHDGSPQGVEFQKMAYGAVVEESLSPFAWMMLGRLGGGFVTKERCGQHALISAERLAKFIANGASSMISYVHPDCVPLWMTQDGCGQNALILAERLAKSIANDASSMISYVHPDCVPLWEALKEYCSKHIREKYNLPLALVPLELARALCHDLLRMVWNGEDSDVNYVFSQSIYDLFIGKWQGANLRSTVKQVFWAGFSHGLGTREAVDVFANWSDRRNKLSIGARDVEHEDTPLGKIMRREGWARACHRTKNDVDFWKVVSKAYAGNERLGSEGTIRTIPYRINILINYMASQIDNSFLSRYEIPIIRDVCSSNRTNRDCQIVVVDFQNSCGQVIQQLIRRLNAERTACICPQQRLLLQSDLRRWLGKDHIAVGHLPEQNFLDASKGAMMEASRILKNRS